MSRPVNPNPCAVDGCVRPPISLGWCGTHYVRWKTHGSTDKHPQFASLGERLAAGLVRMPNGCLEWTGGTDKDGYGKIRVDGKSSGTHRAAWKLANGAIPGGLHVLHHCDNPPCCQTDPTKGYPEGHLFLGTIAQNNADRSAKGRSRGWDFTECPRGHKYGELNARITIRGARHCEACIEDQGAASRNTQARRAIA